MTIGQVAKATGVSASAIRFYESCGILPRPRRKSGIRDYDASIVEQLKILRFYRGTGISIESLTSMFSTNVSARRENRHVIVQRRIVELDDFIKQARAMKRELQRSEACKCNGDTRTCVIFA